MQSLEIKPELKEISHLHHWATYEVTNEGEAEIAAGGLKDIKHRLTLLEDWRKKVVGPIKQGVKEFEDKIRFLRTPLESIDAKLRRALASFWDKRQAEVDEKARQEREKKIEESKKIASENAEIAMMTGSQVAAETAANHTKKISDLEATPIDTSQTIRTTVATVAQVRVWNWECTDPAAVPREFLVIDEKRLNAIAKRYAKEPLQIPGIEFKEQSKVAVMR